MDPLFALLQKDSRRSPEDLATSLNLSAEEVRARISAAEEDGTILGFQAVLDPEKAEEDSVQAMIEVRVTPEKGGGFERIAQRIARFDQVVSCWLMSGGYDLLVVVKGSNLREVARFVAERLSSLEGVLSTATHFQLRAYKQDGFLSRNATESTRLAVAP